MLVRGIVVAEDGALALRFRKMLERQGVVTEVLEADALTPACLRRAAPAVLVVSRAALKAALLARVRRLARSGQGPRVVAVSEQDDPAARAALLAAGCEAVLSRSLPEEPLYKAVEAIVRRCRQAMETVLSRTEPKPTLQDFVSASPPMRALMDMVRRVVETDTSLLILGETGVGKEWLARAIHGEGARRQGPFVAVNCGGLPGPLLESELFGHEAGAFTEATRARRGAFELAHGGTVFLDEVGELPFHLQTKLLRALQDRCIQRVGGENHIPLDVRVMAASNPDLREAVRAGAFRQDVFYRLSVVTLTVPPLRERRADIPALAQSYLAYFRQRIRRTVRRIGPDAMGALQAHGWPGNLRELINVIERAVLLCDRPGITLEHLPATINGGGAESPAAGPGPAGEGPWSWCAPADWTERPLADVRAGLLDAFERAYLRGLLEATHGLVNETAARAGLNVRTVYGKMRQYGLDKAAFRRLTRLPRRWGEKPDTPPSRGGKPPPKTPPGHWDSSTPPRLRSA